MSRAQWRTTVSWTVLMATILASVAATPVERRSAVRAAAPHASGTWIPAAAGAAARANTVPPNDYTGRDSVTGVPRYVVRPFSDDERALLRTRFGVEDPGLLYRNDQGFVVYDSRRDTGLRHFVNTYRLGGASARHPGETFSEFETRIAGKPARYFGLNVDAVERRLGALAPEVREQFSELVAEAERMGLEVTIAETRRSLERQAWLLSRRAGLTYTGTSMHAEGRAADFRIGTGNVRDRRTRAAYTAFRKLALERGFTLTGDWDPGHVELAEPGAPIGYRTIEELLDAAERASGTWVLHRAR
jgi:hypothetical protein